MKRLTSFTFILTFIFAILSSLNAQWTQLNNPPVSVKGIDFASVGSNIFQLTNDSKLLVSSDNGVNWTPVPVPDTLYSFSDIASYGTFLYLLGYSTVSFTPYILRTSNNGVNWSVINSPTPYTILSNFNNILIDNAGIWLATGNWYRGLWFSSNNGTNWTQLINSGSDARAVARMGTNVFCATYNSCYRSTDNGITWTQPFLYSGSHDVIFLTTGTVLVATDNNNTVFRSTDIGQSWQQIPLVGSALVNKYFVVGTTVYATTKDGIYKSTNDGANWSLASFQGYPTYMGWGSGSILLAGTLAGTYRSSNSGTNWSRLLLSSLPPIVYSLAINSNTLYAGTQWGLFKSTNNGTNWTVIGPENWIFKELGFSGSNLIAVVDTFSLSSNMYITNLYLSSNAGINWTKVYSYGGGTNYYIHRIRDFGSFVLASGDGFPILRSTNSGFNWVSVSSISANGFASTGSAIFAATSLGTLRSTNNGINWVTVMSLYSLVVGANNSFVFTKPQNNALFRSSNNGVTWFPTGLYLDISELYVDNSNVVAGGPNGVYFSSDNGVNWFDRNDGFSYIPYVPRLYVSNNYMYAIAGNYTTMSIWRRPYSEVISNVGKLAGTMPTQYQLYQNYPNPFNPKTRIKFDILNSTDVTLDVFDAKGSIVKTLINTRLQPGTYETEFNATSLPSGIYFYRLRAGDFEKTNKMVLLK